MNDESRTRFYILCASLSIGSIGIISAAITVGIGLLPEESDAPNFLYYLGLLCLPAIGAWFGTRWAKLSTHALLLLCLVPPIIYLASRMLLSYTVLKWACEACSHSLPSATHCIKLPCTDALVHFLLGIFVQVTTLLDFSAAATGALLAYFAATHQAKIRKASV